MSPGLLHRFLHAAAVGTGSLLAAFFLVFAGVFSDGPSSLVDPERLVSLALVVGAYLLLGAAATHWARQSWWRWALAIASPATLILVLYTFGEPSGLVLHGMYLAAVLVGSFVGARIGHGFRPAPA